MSAANHEFATRVTLPSSLGAYHELIDGVIDGLAAAGWRDADLFAIRMALEESISNAIRHGNREDPAKSVEVECRGSSREFWVRVCDEGEGFCPEDVPDCCQADRLEAPGGRGLALMRAYMTKMQYNDRGNCLTMEKVLPGQPAS